MTAVERRGARRLGAALAAILVATLAPGAAPALVLATVGAIGAAASCASARQLAGRLALLAPMLLAAVGPRAVLGGSPLELAAAAARVVAAAAWAGWMLGGRSDGELTAGLRALGMPAGMLALLAHTRRFSQQLAATAHQVWCAHALRGGRHTLATTLRAAGPLAGVVLVRALDRAERVACSAALRGAGWARERHDAARGAR